MTNNFRKYQIIINRSFFWVLICLFIYNFQCYAQPKKSEIPVKREIVKLNILEDKVNSLNKQVKILVNNAKNESSNKNSHKSWLTRNEFCGIWGSLVGAVIGGLISGLITVFAVYQTNKENRNQWLNDVFIQNKNELVLVFRDELIEIKSKLDEINISGLEMISSDDFLENFSSKEKIKENSERIKEILKESMPHNEIIINILKIKIDETASKLSSFYKNNNDIDFGSLINSYKVVCAARELPCYLIMSVFNNFNQYYGFYCGNRELPNGFSILPEDNYLQKIIDDISNFESRKQYVKNISTELTSLNNQVNKILDKINTLFQL